MVREGETKDENGVVQGGTSRKKWGAVKENRFDPPIRTIIIVTGGLGGRPNNPGLTFVNYESSTPGRLVRFPLGARLFIHDVRGNKKGKKKPQPMQIIKWWLSCFS